MEYLAISKKQGDNLKSIQNHRGGEKRDSSMFEGKNIHSSPIDGKLLCSYSEKLCMQRRLNGFAFCIRHILEDKGAPFKQCQFFAKYNKSRCINPVPILEQRNYCNSHMQVLGIIPKKLKKKKDAGEKIQSSSSQEISGKGGQLGQGSTQKQHNKLWANQKSLACLKNHCTGNDSKRNQRIDLSRREGRNGVESMMPPLRWNPHSYIWKKFSKRQKFLKHNNSGNVLNPAAEHFRNAQQKYEAETKELFKTYMFERAEDDFFDFEEIPLQSDAAADLVISLDEIPERDIHTRLKHQRSQLTQSIKTRLEDKKMTYSVLQSLIDAAKAAAVATANILNPSTLNPEHKPLRGKRVATSEARCAATLLPNVRCTKIALPYSRHCVKHISCDEDQVLFGKCTARFAVGSHCGIPVVDLMNERPLCNEHALKKINSANKEASLPTKRIKKPEKMEKSRVKVPPPRKNLKAHLQKKFAIPNKPTKKSNCHVGYIVADEDRPPPAKRDSLKMTFKTSADSKWVLGEAGSDVEKSECMVVGPRPYETTENDVSHSSNDLPFDVNTDSLSSPSLLSEDEDHYPLMNMGRNHHDSFTFDDDDDLLRSSSFTMSHVSDSRDIRDITSPTLTQLSAESIPSSLALGELCPPAKLALDKRLFHAPSPLKQESAAVGFKRSLNQAFNNPVTEARERNLASHRTVGPIRSDGLFPVQNSLITTDAYNLNDNNSVHSTSCLALTSNLNSVSYSVLSTASAWATKFTLPTRSDQLTTTGAGFIRVGPTNRNSIYSPPFTSPSPSPRSKADVFKFENHTKPFESDLVVLPRDPPSYSTAVRSLDRKFDVEPPLQKINPDIFLSTVYTVPESSNS